MKIMLVYGTRPEFIKLAPIILEIKKRENIQLTVVSSGQHKEMLTSLEKIFNIEPDISLAIMKDNQSVSQVVSLILNEIEKLLKDIQPDVVMVQGDTATVLATAMACYFSKVRVAHVEAGLRSFDLNHPFPEEFNRRTVSIFADFNFAPTETSAQNLLKEGVDKNKVFVTGNTVIDALQLIRKELKVVKSTTKKILVTAHRRENHEKGIENICDAILELLQKRKDLEFIWPVHPNPNVRKTVYDKLNNVERVTLTDPMEYVDLLAAINEAYLIWTDSGGIQEEAPSFKKPLLILREVTERPEVVSSGFGVLVGTSKDKIINQSMELLEDSKKYDKMISGNNPFGDGKSSKRILDFLKL